MQRAAASQSSPVPPSPSQNATPRASSPSAEPPSKRRKAGSNKISSRNAVPAVPEPQSDLELAREALEEEDARREKALDRLAEEAGETKWILGSIREDNIRTRENRIQIIRTGYGEIDLGRAGVMQGTYGTEGRMTFGRSNTVAEVCLSRMM